MTAKQDATQGDTTQGKKRRHNVGKACENCRRRCVGSGKRKIRLIGVALQESQVRWSAARVWDVPGLQGE
jgi:hypothetical protein